MAQTALPSSSLLPLSFATLLGSTFSSFRGDELTCLDAARTACGKKARQNQQDLFGPVSPQELLQQSTSGQAAPVEVQDAAEADQGRPALLG